MKKLFFLPFVLLIVLLSGCVSFSFTTSDPVQEELLVYINEELPRITPLEIEAITAYESVTGANYTSDQVLYDALLIDVIPNYQQFADQLEAIRLETEEVREIHESYIEGVNLQYNAFNKIVTALEEQDRAMIEEANLMLDDGRKRLRDFKFDIEKLASEHNVELTETFVENTTSL